MKIYVVSHYYDNGESYEDYRDYEDHEFYSTLELASAEFWGRVTEDYEGKWVLRSVELDTQDSEVLEESVWIKCTGWNPYEQDNPEPDYDDYDPMEEYEKEYYWDGCPKHPEKNLHIAWEYLDWCNDEIDRAEWETVDEYLSSESTNYREWEEVNREIEEKRQAILLESLNNVLNELLVV
jgi:hypothetical protein